MPGGSIFRFLALAAFIVAVAIGLWLADVSGPLVVLGVALAWAIAALYEWLAWRESDSGWPTFERAPPARRDPVAAPPLPAPRPAQPAGHQREPEAEPEPQPASPQREPRPEPEPIPDSGSKPEPELEPESEVEPDPPQAAEPEPDREPEPEPAPEPEPEPEAEPEPEPQSEPVRTPKLEPEPRPARESAPAVAGPTTSRFRGLLRRPGASTPPEAEVSSIEPAPDRVPKPERPVPESAPPPPRPRIVPAPPPRRPVPLPPAAQRPPARLSERRRAPQQWNLWELERFARAESQRSPERTEEWAHLVFHLRPFAEAGGTLPVEFDGLVRESFGSLLDRLER